MNTTHMNTTHMITTHMNTTHMNTTHMITTHMNTTHMITTHMITTHTMMTVVGRAGHMQCGTILTVGLSTDEAGGCTVEEGQEARHGQADVGVGGPQVQRGEAGKLDLQDVLGSHLHVRHLWMRRRTQDVSRDAGAFIPCTVLSILTESGVLEMSSERFQCGPDAQTTRVQRE